MLFYPVLINLNFQVEYLAQQRLDLTWIHVEINRNYVCG